MNTKLHTTTCHSELVEESHSLINKLSHRLTLSCFLFLFSCLSFAQNYDWQWAVSGGSPNGNESETGINFQSEQIYDVKTGTDGNYYYIATMKGLNLTQLAGQPVTVYNHSLGGKDIFLFSTDCEGQVRWSQAIGGWADDVAYNLVLDDSNNIYLGVNVRNESPGSGPGDRRPLHFTENDSIPFPDLSGGGTLIPQDGFKSTYLLKYDSNGGLVNRVALQGDVIQTTYQSRVLDLAIGADKLHFIVGFDTGTHLDGNITVVNNSNNFKYYLAQYDLDLNYVNSFALPIADGTGFECYFGQTHFAYDETLNRYYVAGMRSAGINDVLLPLTYDGDAFEERSFVLAFSGTDGSEVWRREIYSDPDPQFGYTQVNDITSLFVDNNSEVYIAGTFFTYDSQNLLPIKIYDPSDTQITPYIFTPGIYAKIPTVVKFNSSGAVQWAKTPTAYGSNFTTPPGSVLNKGLAVRGNEIAFGSPNGYYIWDSFVNNPPQFRRLDAALIRLNKQTGNVIGMHIIEGDDADSAEFTTAVAVDNDGNYVVGGAFYTTLFGNNPNVNQLVTSGGNDFFVAKLAASECGTTVGTEEFNNIKINVYPNPTTDKVYFETEEKLKWYNVYNQNAQQVQVQTQINETNYQMSLDGLPTGVYFVLIKTESGKSTTVKVVKE